MPSVNSHNGPPASADISVYFQPAAELEPFVDFRVSDIQECVFQATSILNPDHRIILKTEVPDIGHKAHSQSIDTGH
jgi:hypothetical protein